MSKNNDQPMTIDKLAEIMGREFNRVSDRFDVVDKRFEDIEKKLATKAELFEMEQRLDKRLTKVENRVEDVYGILRQFEEYDILDLQKRMQILEKAFRILNKQLRPH